jgi:hypothetical protein
METEKKKIGKGPGARKAVRFQDKESLNALINGKIPALAFSEASKGCGLVVLSSVCPDKDEEVKVKIGALASLRGVVRWRKPLDKDVAKIGVEYLE